MSIHLLIIDCLFKTALDELRKRYKAELRDILNIMVAKQEEKLAEELRAMVKEEEERRAAAGREKEDTINAVRKESFARLSRVKKENEKREKVTKAGAEQKETKLVLESKERVEKAMAEQEALIKMLRTQQRQEEDEALRSYDSQTCWLEGTVGQLSFSLCLYLQVFPERGRRFWGHLMHTHKKRKKETNKQQNE